MTPTSPGQFQARFQSCPIEIDHTDKHTPAIRARFPQFPDTFPVHSLFVLREMLALVFHDGDSAVIQFDQKVGEESAW